MIDLFELGRVKAEVLQTGNLHHLSETPSLLRIDNDTIIPLQGKISRIKVIDLTSHSEANANHSLHRAFPLSPDKPLPG